MAKEASKKKEEKKPVAKKAGDKSGGKKTAGKDAAKKTAGKAVGKKAAGKSEKPSGRAAMTGDTVTFHYHGTRADGAVFDSTRERAPMQVTLGYSQLIPGVDNALLGMAAGEKKTVTLDPDNAYGPRQEGLVMVIPRAQVPPDIKKGEELEGPGPDGTETRLRVVEVTDAEVTLDYNHPLAGETLTFELELISVGTATN